MGSIYEELQESFGSVATHLKTDSDSKEDVLDLFTADKDECKHENRKKLSGPDFKVKDSLEYCVSCGIALDPKDPDKSIEKCEHKDVFEAPNGLFTCRHCCTEIELYSFRPEWRYYGASDNRSSKDPSRCHYSRGNSDRGLEQTFSNSRVEIPLALRKATEKKYNKIILTLRKEGGKSTVRGRRKTSIVAACLLQAYKEEFGEYRTATHIRNCFDLSQKDMSRGLQEYFKTFPEDRNGCTEPEDLIRWQMSLAGVHISHYASIRKIAEYLKQSSQNFTRSNPQSVSASILYYYLCLNKEYKDELGITKKNFANKIGLSEITINKLVTEIIRVTKYPVEI